MRNAILMLSALILAACMRSPEEVRLDHAEQCAGYGYEQGTEAYSQCLMFLDSERQANRRAAAMASMMYRYQPATTTTCRRVGDFLQCQ